MAAPRTRNATDTLQPGRVTMVARLFSRARAARLCFLLRATAGIKEADGGGRLPTIGKGLLDPWWVECAGYQHCVALTGGMVATHGQQTKPPATSPRLSTYSPCCCLPSSHLLLCLWLYRRRADEGPIGKQTTQVSRSLIADVITKYYSGKLTKR